MRRQLLGIGDRGVDDRPVRHEVVDESDAQCLLGVHHAARQQQVGGAAASHEPGQQPGDAVFGDQSPLGEGGREPGGRRGEPDVAVEGFHHSETGGDPVDRPDQRLAQCRGKVAGARPEEVFFGDVTDGLQASEVGACAEPAPGAGHDDRAYAGVVLGVAQQREVAVLEVVGPGVQLVRPVEREHQDRSTPLGEDQVCVLGCHACSSSELW